MTQPSIESNIEAARDRLVEALQPERIILFGSHVWGTPSADSDLDFLVIVSDSDLPPHKRAQLAYRSLMGLGAPCDVLVQTHAETERLSQVATSLTRRVLEQGRVIHG
jgi:predicted nucleotidyltransferase